MGPDEYILQRAYQWRATEKRLIASDDEGKTEARTAHKEAKKELREAVDRANHKQGK